MNAATVVHRPVMPRETLDALAVRPGGVYLDATVGGGGHAALVLDRCAPGGMLLALDRDPAALARARDRLRAYGGRVTFAHGDFADLGALADRAGRSRFDGVLFDLGFSSDQVGDAGRGFSFRAEGPLDMRLDPSGGATADELVNHLPEAELADLIHRYGEERHGRRIARAIAVARPISTTTDLADVVRRAVGGHPTRIDPATRTFQALRIAVNDELGAIARAIPQAVDRLAARGRLVVLSYHSLEDRIVKHALRDAARDCLCPPGLPVCRCGHRAVVRLVERRPLRPTREETLANPRARSARLRVAERIVDAGVGADGAGRDA